MKAIILAAGRGERMRPLTDTCPKPLLKVAGLPLIEHHINKLRAAGITDIVINHAWLGQQIEDYFGNGEKWSVNIVYSPETQGALETAGGIIKALPLLLGKELEENQSGQFLVVNGDVYSEMSFAQIPALSPGILAHLYLIENPEHNLAGDFQLSDGRLTNKDENAQHQSFTYSGIGLYHSDFFSGLALNANQSGDKALALGPLLRQYAQAQKISASVVHDFWTDVGTPERLAQLNQALVKRT